MDRIVHQGQKVDFHIHSAASSKKDGSLVKDGTIENIPVLLSKLQENSIDMFAITDHDCFDYSLYRALKEYEGKEFKKILPGVEFSVGIETKSESVEAAKQVHVIAVFDDSNDEKVKGLERLLKSQNYDAVGSKNSQMFAEKTFRDILQKSGMNVCLIAHQKNSPGSEKQSSPDAKALGTDKFNELLNFGYFEAYEFKTENTHVFHYLFKKRANEIYEKVRFITGSDCHQWEAYPHHDKCNAREGEMSPTFLKCLPTFRGLAMALTDDTRILRNNTFFSNSNNFLESLDYSIKGNKFSIPLSRGINAIIGDNSKGKSMFLHELTNYRKTNDGKATPKKKKEYANYLKSKDIKIDRIKNNLNFQFDFQGEIRNSFETGTFFSNPLIKKFQPAETDSSVLKEKLENSFQKFYGVLSDKFSLDQEILNFFNETIDLNVEPSPGVSLQPKKIPDFSFEESSTFESIVSNLKKTLTPIDEALKFITDPVDKKLLTETRNNIVSLIKKYSSKTNLIEWNNKIRNCINDSIDSLISEQSAIQNGKDAKWTAFETASEHFADKISTILRKKSKITVFRFSFEKYTPDYEHTELSDVKLVSRFASNKAFYDSSFCEELLANVMKQGTDLNNIFDLQSLTKDRFLSSIKDKDETASDDPVDILKVKINIEIENALKSKQVIIKKGEDVTATYSAGFNSAKYIDILAHSKENTIYIIDQPEDDISQPSIKASVVKDLKEMSKNKQIILVTHNPQFVVNLDADNVIYFHDTKDGVLQIESGALEYQDENLDILKIVSENLDGGVDSLRKRWKRYEKTITD